MKEASALNPDGHAHYMRPLDGIRGLACMLVIIAHITQTLKLDYVEKIYDFGSMGVVLFFVLSGFLMSALYSEKQFSLDSAGKYSIARFTRIAPAYWIAIVVSWVLFMIIPDFEYQMTPFNLLRSIFFAGTEGVLWSIPPEVQFYGFFLLLWFSWHKSKEGNHIFLIFSVLLSLALVATKEMWGGAMLPSKLHLFLAGFLAAFVAKHPKVLPVLCSTIFQIGITLLFICYVSFVLGEGEIYNDLTIPFLAGLMIASLSRSSLFTWPLETHTMRMIGAASFSIYLFHDMILKAMDHFCAFNSLNIMLSIAIMCFVSIALPVAFHYAVEKRLNISSKKWLLEKFEMLKRKYPKFSF